MARPRVNINWESFESLCGIQCTLSEIAGFFKCSEDTIERAVKRHYKLPFADVFKQKRGIGAISLRRKMYQKAVDGENVVMMIWLSKQYLGFSDKTTNINAEVDPNSLLTDEQLVEKENALRKRLGLGPVPKP